MEEIDDKVEQIRQRGDIQFKLIEFNILGTGAIASLALNKSEYWDALLVLPFISFLLFLLWVHYGIAIRLMNWVKPKAMSFWSVTRLFTFATVILTNFVGVPICSILLHELGRENLPIGLLRVLGLWVFPVFTLFLFLMWIYIQYFKKTVPCDALTAEHVDENKPK